jgi:hypothetical protein
MKRFSLIAGVAIVMLASIAFAQQWIRVIPATSTAYYGVTTTKTFASCRRVQMQIQTPNKHVWYSIDKGAGTTPSGYWAKYDSSASDTPISEVRPPIDLPIRSDGFCTVNLQSSVATDTPIGVTVYFWVYK